MLYSRGAMVEFASTARMKNRIDNNVSNSNPVNSKKEIRMNIYENCVAVSLSSNCLCERIHSSFTKKSRKNSSTHRLLIPNMRSVNVM